jgi:hypothetical protein
MRHPTQPGGHYDEHRPNYQLSVASVCNLDIRTETSIRPARPDTSTLDRAARSVRIAVAFKGCKRSPEQCPVVISERALLDSV